MSEEFLSIEEQKAALEEKAKRLRKRELNDIAHVLRDAEGRRLFWRVFSLANIFQPAFVQGKPDQSSFNDGIKALALALFNDMNQSKPSAFEQMRREAATDILTRNEE